MDPPAAPLSSCNRLVRDFTYDDPSEEPSFRATSDTRNIDGTASQHRDSLDGQPPFLRIASGRSASQRSVESRGLNVQSPDLQSPDQQPTDVHRMDAHIDNMRNADFILDLDAIEEHRSSARSKSSMSQHTEHTEHTHVTSSSTSRLPDFFGAETFQIVLHNPATAHQLLLFSQSRLCGENMEFLEKVDLYHSLLNDVTKTMFEIHRDFISVNSPNQINIGESLLININKSLKYTLSSILPKMEAVFIDAQNDIERLVSSDVYPRFVRHQMSMSAAKALASDRSRYGGLGDCFVLTSPAKADNPILYASDGFVKVTGYARTEIIPRNCRFLQGRYTERSAVHRIKKAIDDRKESVELLLNYKKNKEPFWNLLYTAPLFDGNGNVIFFIGGQINCSTTVHNASDIIRILSVSEDVDNVKESGTMSPAPEKPSKGSSLFKAFRGNNSSKSAPPARMPGMENSLLNSIDKMDLRKQMDAFYTAYSKYLVINYTTFFISFYSAGIVDLLYPHKHTFNQMQIVGTDVFRFLKGHAANDSARDFKSKVKAALKMGQPISLDLTLCTRRYMGFEEFVTHWTPLKDDVGRIEFVVLTLGSLQV